MDTKKHLEQLSMIDLDINSKLKEIDDLTKLTKKLSGVTENMIVGADSSESILSPTMRKIVDLQTVYSQDMAELLGRKNCIIKAIEAVENDTYRAILQMRYVQRSQWQSIADELGYDLRHVYRLHNAALKAIQLDCAA